MIHSADQGFYVTDDVFEQVVKDLIVFGTNQIEFAHVTFAKVDDNGIPRDDAHTIVRFAAIVDKYIFTQTFCVLVAKCMRFRS